MATLKSYLFFVLLPICLFSNPLLAGGPWPQPKGSGYFKLYQWWLSYDEHYTDSGLLDPNVTTGVYNTTLYAEYGLTDRLTGVLNFPFFSRNTMNNLISQTTGETLVPGEALNSLGDTELGVRYALSQPGSRLPIALSLTLGLPLGNDLGGEQENLQTGDGEFNQLLQIHAGSSLSPSLYWSAYVGVNNRTNGFSDEFRWGLEAGINFIDSKLWIVGRLQGNESFFNGETAAETDNTSIFANNAEFLSPGVEVNYYVTRQIGVSAGVAGAVRGQLIAAAPAYSVGVFLDLNR